jgi:hypothetical protein
MVNANISSTTKKTEIKMDQKIKELADSFFEWPTEDKSCVTLTSALLFAEKIAEITKQNERDSVNNGANCEMSDKDFLTWIYERLEHVHGENPRVDYMRRLRMTIEAMPWHRKLFNTVQGNEVKK